MIVAQLMLLLEKMNQNAVVINMSNQEVSDVLPCVARVEGMDTLCVRIYAGEP